MYTRRSLFHRLQEAAGPEAIVQEHGDDGQIMYRFQNQLWTPGELADYLGVEVL